MRFKKGSKEAKDYMAKLRAKKDKKTPAKKTVGATKKTAGIRAKKAYNKDVDAYKYFVVNNGKVEAGFEFKSDAQDMATDFYPPAKVLTLQALKKAKIKDPRNDWKYKIGATLIIDETETKNSKPRAIIRRKRRDNGTFKSFSYVSGYKQTPEIIVGKIGSLTVLKALAPEVKLRITRGKKVTSAKIRSAKDTVEILRKFITPSKVQTQEFACAIFLNNNNDVLAVYQLGMGGFTATVFEKRLLFAAALKLGATAIILCHNHPSGSLTPSQADKTFTKQVSEVADLHDIKVLDHIILTKENYYSFAENGIL
jgi:DNA repair protein RadC